MLVHEELTSNAYDDIRFQRVIIEEMGELLPAKLLAECDLSRARSVLEIGCGTGEWLRAVARQYPDLQCIGIDQNELQVKAANALAYRDGLAQVAFLAHEINDLPPSLFPEASFDLVHLSFLSRYILTADYPTLAKMCAALCCPGGIVCWTEAELPITTSAAFERLTAFVCEALQRAGQSFISESMWEWGELVTARSGKPGVDRSLYKRRHLGITPMLGRWLRDAGCGAQRERPLYSIWGIDERVIYETAYSIEVSAGQPAHDGFVAQARRFAGQVKPFLLRTGVIEEREHAALCGRLATELTGQEFCGLSHTTRLGAAPVTPASIYMIESDACGRQESYKVARYVLAVIVPRRERNDDAISNKRKGLWHSCRVPRGFRPPRHLACQSTPPERTLGASAHRWQALCS